MRKPRSLVVPFKFREGYPDEIVDAYIGKAVSLIEGIGIEVELAKNVVFDADADYTSTAYNPSQYDIAVFLLPTWFEPGMFARAVKNLVTIPVVIWGFSNFIHNGERVNLGSSAGAGAAKGTLREMGVWHRYIYYSPGIGKDAEINKVLSSVANMGRAVALLKSARILAIGYLFGGMTIGDIDFTRLRNVFGIDMAVLDNYTLIQLAENINIKGEEFLNAREDVKNLLANDPGDKLEKIVRMYLAIKKMVEENRAQAVTLKCHFVLSQEYGFTPCIPLSVLGDALPASCEADIPVVLTQLVMHYLSGGGVTAYADTHELVDDRILLAACGYAPAGVCLGGKIKCAEKPKGPATGLGATFKDYITNVNHLKSGPMTIARFLIDSDRNFSLHCATGIGIGDIGKTSELGCPQYAFTEMKLNCNLDSFAQEMGSHHYALIYSDMVEALKLFCDFKKIPTAIAGKV